MRTVVNDTFTGPAGQALNAHVGEQGATWTKRQGGSLVPVISDTGTRLRAGSNNAQVWTPSGQPATAEQQGTMAVHVFTVLATNPSIHLRHDGLGATGYCYKVVIGNTTIDVVRITSAGSNTIASWGWAPAAGSDHTVVAHVAGSTITVTLDGTTLGTVSDTTVPSGDYYAIGMTGGGGIGNAVGLHIDSVTFEDAAVAPAAPTSFATPTQFGAAYVDTSVTTSATAGVAELRYYVAPNVGGVADTANKVLVGTLANPAASSTIAHRLSGLTLAPGSWFFGAAEATGAESAVTWAAAAITLPALGSASALQDDYSAAPDPRWEDWSDNAQTTIAQTTGAAGKLTLSRTASVAGYAARLDGDRASLLPGERVYIRMDASAWASDAGSEVDFVLSGNVEGDGIGFYLTGSTLHGFVKVGGALVVDQALGTYSGATHRWLSVLRTQDGKLQWETAPDDALGTGPGVWTMRHSELETVFTPGFDRLSIQVFGGSFNAQSAGGSVSFDGLNTRTVPSPPPAAPTAGAATVLDSSSARLDYTDQSTDETHWRFFTAPDLAGAPDTASAVQVAEIATSTGAATGGALSYTFTGLTPGVPVWLGVASAGAGGPSAVDYAPAAVTTPSPPNLGGITSPHNGEQHSEGGLWPLRVTVTDVTTHEWKSDLDGVLSTAQNPDVTLAAGTDDAPATHILTYTGTGPGGTVSASVTVTEGLAAAAPTATPTDEDDDMRTIPWGDTRPQPLTARTTDGALFTSAFAAGDVKIDLQDGAGFVNVANLPALATAGSYFEWTPTAAETSRNHFALRIQKTGVQSRVVFFLTEGHPDAYESDAEAYGTLAAAATDGAALISLSGVVGSLSEGDAFVLSPSGARGKILSATSTGAGAYDVTLAGEEGLSGSAGVGETFVSYLDLPADKAGYGLSVAERAALQQVIDAATTEQVQGVADTQSAMQQTIGTLSTFDPSTQSDLIATALLDLAAAVDGRTFRQVLRAISAVLLGRDVGTATAPKYEAIDGSKVRVAGTVDASGRRSAVTLTTD